MRYDRDAERDIDTVLHDAGTEWRTRQVFGPVRLTPTGGRQSSRLAILGPNLIGLVAVLAVGVGVAGLGVTQLGGIGSSKPGPSTAVATERLEPTNAPPSLDAEGVEAARIAVVEAINADRANFGVPYVDEDGVLVIPYVGENAGRAAVEEVLTPGLAVRWEKVEYSRSELGRIADEIKDMHLEGVFAISSGTSQNRVIVKVGPWGSADEVSRALAGYGAAVLVEVSSDVPVILPMPSPTA
jgi:hypothetical protein